MERFGRRDFETHVEETNTSKQTKPLHVMKETMDSKSLQKTIEEADDLHDTSLEARPSSCILAQGGMEISLPRGDLNFEKFPTSDNEGKGNCVVMHRVDLAPHAEEEGALAPIDGILALLQGSPQDLKHGGPSTINEQHDCAAL